MKHPAASLNLIQREPSQAGKRYALVGVNPYIKTTFRKILGKGASSITEEVVDITQLRASTLRIRDLLLTQAFVWDKPLIWIEGAEHLFAAMSFPEDFPSSNHLVVCCAEVDSTYIPGSFIPILIETKSSNLQDFVKWLMTTKGLTSEIDVVRFLTAEFKENLPGLEKLLDQLYLRIHPRTVVTMKDLESDVSLEWDCDLIIRALVSGDEGKALKEITLALQTFHPKGIVTVLTRKVILLIQISSSLVLNSGPDPSSDIRPWVWRNNADLLKEIPQARLFKWSVALDKAYVTLSRNYNPHRWTLFNLVAEMSRA